MYFGVRYAVRRVDADPELAGLLITGTGDVFIPGGDLGQQVSDKPRSGERAGHLPGPSLPPLAPSPPRPPPIRLAARRRLVIPN